VDFEWPENEAALAAAAATFGREVLNAGLDERDRAGEFDRALWRKCAEFGILGLPLPERYGGAAQGVLPIVRTLEALGYGCRDDGLLFALGAQLWSVEIPILLFGSDDQKERYLPAFARGDLVGAHAVTEPESGSDAHSLRTEAARDGCEYVLNGSKAFITNAPHADVFLVLVTLDVSQGSRALAAFLLDRETEGLSVARPYDKIGLHTAPMAEVAFTDCRVPASAMLGQPGAGRAIFGAAMEWERSFILAPALGAMARQIDDCVRYARSRTQFARPIGKNESLANKLVDMQMRLEVSQLLMYRTAWLKQTGRRLTREPSQIKLLVSESWVHNSLDALQIHGGYGFMTELGIGRDLAAAVASRIYSGTSEIQRRIIASFMGL
jgi:alkylation response protein AidB-like acyl-CoA dehydrogenase